MYVYMKLMIGCASCLVYLGMGMMGGAVPPPTMGGYPGQAASNPFGGAPPAMGVGGVPQYGGAPTPYGQQHQQPPRGYPPQQPQQPVYGAQPPQVRVLAVAAAGYLCDDVLKSIYILHHECMLMDPFSFPFDFVWSVMYLSIYL